MMIRKNMRYATCNIKKIQIVGGPMIMEMSKMLPAPPFFSGTEVIYLMRGMQNRVIDDP